MSEDSSTPWTAKTTFAAAGKTDMVMELEIKKRQRSHRIEEVPQSYLSSI
jgi:hypothetical protein